MPDMDAEKSHFEELDEWLLNEPPRYGRKLTFSEKCGIASALKKGVSHTVVAKAFNLSRATVSLLANCLQPGAKHYPDVYRELQTIGPQRFHEKHYTREMHYRLKRVRDGLIQLDENQTDIAPGQPGPDPRATKYAGEFLLPDNSSWKIFFRPSDDNHIPTGWYFMMLAADGHPPLGITEFHGAERIRGADGHEPFRTSADAFDGLYAVNGWPNPRPKPGRPKNK
jgi:hypothetical protein